MKNKNNKKECKHYMCILLLGTLLLFVGVGVYNYLYTPALQFGLTNSNKCCIFYWISLVCSLIGAILMLIGIFININICRSNKSQSDCEQEDTPCNNFIKPYIDDLITLKSKYECVRNRQNGTSILLVVAKMSFVFVPYIRDMYKIGLIFTYEYNSLLLGKLNKIDNDQSLFLLWDSIPLFTIFIILCILLFYMIYRIHNTSHKIDLINSTITKISLYHHGNHYNNGTLQFSIESDGDDVRYYWTIDGKWLTNENGNKIPNQTNGVITIFKIECGYFKYSTDGGKSWCKANAFEHEKEMLYIEKKIQLEINRLTQELNTDSSRDIWRAIFNSH